MISIDHEFQVSFMDCEGLEQEGEKRAVMSLVKDWKPNKLFFQETKLKGDIKLLIQKIWGGRWVEHVCLEACGTRGGHCDVMEYQVMEGGNS